MQKRYLFYTEIYAFFTEGPGQSKNRLMMDLGIMVNRVFKQSRKPPTCTKTRSFLPDPKQEKVFQLIPVT
jgi:hypothetical protein